MTTRARSLSRRASRSSWNFFFQAEDGIRDHCVTGVQTCALPIWSAQAREILGRIARGQTNPDLQRKAVEYLGLFGGSEARKTLAEVYASSSDASVKHAILRSYMIGGDHEHLFAAAKSEKDESLRREAIRQLGLVHGTSELEQLYQAETSTDLRRDILQAFFLAGDSGRLVTAAQGEKDADLRRAAI